LENPKYFTHKLLNLWIAVTMIWMGGSDASDASESYMPLVTSQAHSSEIHGLKDNNSNGSVGLQVTRILGESPTREDINLRAGIKANYRRCIKSQPIANKCPPLAKGTIDDADAESTHPDTIWTVCGRKSSKLTNDNEDETDDETLTLEYDMDDGAVKTASTNKRSSSGRDRQPILQDPFSGQVFKEVPFDKEGACCSSEDDEDVDEVMGDSDYEASDLCWSYKEALYGGWYADDADGQDDHDPPIDAQTLRKIEDMFGMDWDPRGVYIPPPNVKRGRTSTPKAKYEEMFDEEMGAVFAYLHIVLWGGGGPTSKP
jgi:hypothetical protein